MNTKIVVALVAIAFVTGMVVNATEIDAAKKASPSDVKKYTSQTLKVALKHLQLSNDFFLDPPEGGIPEDDIDEVQRLIGEIKSEHETMGDKILVYEPRS